MLNRAIRVSRPSHNHIELLRVPVLFDLTSDRNEGQESALDFNWRLRLNVNEDATAGGGTKVRSNAVERLRECVNADHAFCTFDHVAAALKELGD
jgi:hypothetical protein